MSEEKCPTCNGTGACDSCKGQGCSACNKSGMCTTCKGWGTIGSDKPDDDLDENDTGWNTHNGHKRV